MTEQQKESIKRAQSAFVAALDAGVEEDSLIEAVFDAKLERELLLPEEGFTRELPTYRPLFWFELPEGPKREALRLEQEKPGYKHFNR